MAEDGYQPAAAASSGYPSEKKYDGYFQYAKVPGDHEYEFGYNRGNPPHYTSRYEQAKDWRFRTKVIHFLFKHFNIKALKYFGKT